MGKGKTCVELFLGAALLVYLCRTTHNQDKTNRIAEIKKDNFLSLFSLPLPCSCSRVQALGFQLMPSI